MEPILSEKELEDIFAVAREQVSDAREIKEVSLTARRRFESRAAGIWLEAAKVMKPAFTSVISGATGDRVEIDLLDIVALDGAMLGSDSLVDMEADGWVYNVYSNQKDDMIVGASKVLARSYIGRRTGIGVGQVESPRKDESFTALEKRILTPFFNSIVEAVGLAVPRKTDFKSSTKEPAEVLGGKRRKQAWLEMTVHCKGKDDLGIWVAANALLFSSGEADLAGSMARQMNRTPIQVSADLGKTTMTVQSFRNLNLGQIVCLDRMRGDPFPVLIAGIPKLLGEPLSSRGNVALKITGRIENGASR